MNRQASLKFSNQLNRACSLHVSKFQQMLMIYDLQGEAGNVDAEAELTVLVSPTVTRVGPPNVTVSRGALFFLTVSVILDKYSCKSCANF